MGGLGLETIGKFYEAQVQESFIDGKQNVIAPYEDVETGGWDLPPESGDRNDPQVQQRTEQEGPRGR